eukprot:699445-Amphidinium_carterae.2
MAMQDSSDSGLDAEDQAVVAGCLSDAAAGHVLRVPVTKPYHGPFEDSSLKALYTETLPH